MDKLKTAFLLFLCLHFGDVVIVGHSQTTLKKFPKSNFYQDLMGEVVKIITTTSCKEYAYEVRFCTKHGCVTEVFCGENLIPLPKKGE